MGQKDGSRSDGRVSDDLSRQELERGADLSSLLDVRPEGLIILDHQGCVTHANAAAARILGIPEPDLIGLSFIDHPWKISTIEGDPFAEGEPPFLRRIRDRKAISAEAFSILHEDGSRRLVSIRTASAPGEGGGPAATAILLSEIAAHPGADRSSTRNGEMESFALLVGGIGNDFNNILTAILGNTSLAKIDVDPDGDVYRTLNYIEKASMRARGLAQRLLDLSRSRASDRQSAAAAPVTRAPASREIIPGTGRVLVMDDEEMVREVLGKMLGRLGYATSLAADGAEALALYRQALGSGRRFEAVLVDLTVPGGMGGREMMVELLKLDPAARVVVSTGFSTDPILSEFKRHGFVGAVCKPYEIAELSHTIHAAIISEGQ